MCVSKISCIVGEQSCDTIAGHNYVPVLMVLKGCTKHGEKEENFNILVLHNSRYVYVYMFKSRPRQLSVLFFHCLPSDYALPCLAFLCIYMYKI